MSTYDQLNGIKGSDDIAPVHNPYALFKPWALPEIFVPGGPGEGRYIPNVGDLVYDILEEGDIPIQRVIAVDIVTGKSTYRPWGNTPNGLVSERDLLTGVGNITLSSTFILYLDKSVTPYTCVVDNRLIFPNPETTYIRMMRGAVMQNNPNIASLYYDNNGNLLGNDVPTRAVLLNDNSAPTGIATAKYIPTFHTLEELLDNEVVTVIGYNPSGHVSMRRQLRVENTGFLSHRNNSIKYITHISLESPFMSETDMNLIELPVNVPLQGLYLIGVVHYSDGSTKKYPVDGSKFTMLGLRDFVATSENIRVPLVLRYTLSANEVAYGAAVGEERYMVERYQVLTKAAIGAYNVKIYAYPEWIDATQGYTLRFFLYNSDRNLKYDITRLIEYAKNSEPFRPKAYGVMQNLSVAVNLKEVSSTYVSYRYNTTIQLVLWRQATEKITNWAIYFVPGQNPPFGENNYAKLKFINSNYYLIQVDCDATNMYDWLERLYWKTNPIFSSFKETKAPLPTHFRIKVGTVFEEYPIEEWSKTKQILGGLKYTNTVYLYWIAKTPTTELELGITGLPCWEDQSLVIPANP